MKEQRRVFQKINKIKEKTELGTQKIELGIIQDVIQEFKKGQDLFTSAESTMDRAVGILENAEKMYNKAEAEASRLGFEIPRETRAIGERIKAFVKEGRRKLN